MRPNIDTHDYDVKMRNAVRFLEDENKVKVTMRFRGREMAHQELGLEVLYKVRDDLADLTKVEFEPKLEGRQMTMILAPLPAKPVTGRPVIGSIALTSVIVAAPSLPLSAHAATNAAHAMSERSCLTEKSCAVIFNLTELCIRSNKRRATKRQRLPVPTVHLT